MRKIKTAISSDLCIRLTWNLTGTSWVVSYGGKTIPRWRTAAILKIDISPYLCVKSWDFHDVIKKWKSCIGQTPSSTERISCSKTTTSLPTAKCTRPPLPRSNWLRRASIRLAWYRHMPASSFLIIFIARQHTDTRYWYGKSVCLSVRLSVTFRYQMKTA